MKLTKIFVTAILILPFLIPAALSAQDEIETPDDEGLELVDPDDIPDDFVWAITRYSSRPEDIVESVNDDLQNGNYIPVGIEADPDISILMIQNDQIDFTNWVIHEFDDPDMLEEEINSGLAEGWVPMDIARTENGITALLLETDLSINGWRLTTSRATDEAITETITELQNEGYAIWGSALDGEGIWLLGIRETGEPQRETQFASYPDDPEELQQAINDNIQELWVPWSLSLSQGQIFLTYLR